MLDKCANASIVSVAEVVEWFWRRYLAVLRDASEMGKSVPVIVVRTQTLSFSATHET